MLQPFEQNSAEKSKHKFMVQTMIAPKKFQLDNLDTVVSKLGETTVGVHYLELLSS